MTTVAVRDTNPATKMYRIVQRYKVTYRRPHGRRNVRKRMKIKELPL